MIFVLRDLDWWDSANPNHRRGLHNILMAGVNRWHFVAIECLNIERIMSAGFLGEEAGAQLVHAYSNRAERLAIVDGEPVKIAPGPEGMVAREGEIIVPIDRFLDLDALLPTVFLVENDRDAFAYLSFVGKRIREKFGGAVGVRAKPEPGGGGESAARLRRLRRHRNPALLVVLMDTDKHCPNCPVKRTTSDVAQAIYELDQAGTVGLKQFNFGHHELENVFPDSVRSMIDQVGERRRFDEMQQFLARHYQIANNLWKYADYKLGMTYSRYLSMDECCIAFWAPLLDAPRVLINNGCRRAGKCAVQGECRCRIYPKVGGGFVSNLEEKLKQIKDSDVDTLWRNDALADRAQWRDDVGESLSPWFAAEPSQTI